MMHSQDATAGKVLIRADSSVFHPPSIEITKGQRTTLEFRRATDETCASAERLAFSQHD